MKILKTIAPASWIASAVLLVVALLLLGKPMRSFVYELSARTQGALRNAYSDASLFFESVPRAVSILKEHENLLSQRDEFDRALAALEQIQRENDALRQILSLQKNSSFQHTLAEPIGLEIANDILLVNKGRRQGIRPGMIVITPALALVGRVVETDSTVSRIMLLSHPESSFDGTILQKNITGVLKGQGSGTLIFDLIPRDAPAEAGDMVVTNRFSAAAPHTISMGTLRRIVKKDESPFVKAFITPAYGNQRVDTPVIIIRANEERP